MRIIVTADLHYGNPNDSEGTGPFDEKAHAIFAEEIFSLKPDVLLVVGDCAEICMTRNHLSKMFEVYENPHGVSICTPGNHDIWGSQEEPKLSHWEQFDWFFEQASMAGWVGLRNDPWVNDGVCIAGGMGWYDFSTRDPVVQFDSPELFDKFVFDNQKWSDYRWMGMNSAIEVNARRMKEFRDCLAKVPPPDKRRALVVVSHFPGFSRLLIPDSSPNFGAAFMGNLEIGKLTIEAEADYYFCGHSHRRAEFVLGKTKCINNGSGYGRGAHRYDVIEI